MILLRNDGPSLIRVESQQCDYCREGFEVVEATFRPVDGDAVWACRRCGFENVTVLDMEDSNV